MKKFILTFPEPSRHTFYQDQFQSIFLKKNGIDVQKFVTKKPDLVFDFNGKKHAIEVETGSVLSKIKNLREKVELLNKNYDKWFLLLQTEIKSRNISNLEKL